MRINLYVSVIIGAVVIMSLIGIDVILTQQGYSKVQVSSDISIVHILQNSSLQTTQLHFQPSIITVVIGKNNTVEWTNDDIVFHWISADRYENKFAVTAIELPLDKPMSELLKLPNVMPPGKSFSYTFTETGIFGYHGRPWERGIVIVIPSSSNGNI